MKLVELAFPDAADEDTRTRARALCEHLGKTAVEVPDVPGFVVNRLLFPYLFSAVRLIEETGMDPEDVDTCMKLGAGHPMGPLALLDLVGLDVSMAIGEEIGAEIPETVERLVAEGALGRKSGRGFYAVTVTVCEAAVFFRRASGSGGRSDVRGQTFRNRTSSQKQTTGPPTRAGRLFACRWTHPDPPSLCGAAGV